MQTAIDVIKRSFSNGSPSLSWLRNLSLSAFHVAGPAKTGAVRYAMGNNILS
jgi:2-polyprenyl-6-methoxyphenol hydroxylase-like FAD-dependent oxidoreductase